MSKWVWGLVLLAACGGTDIPALEPETTVIPDAPPETVPDATPETVPDATPMVVADAAPDAEPGPVMWAGPDRVVDEGHYVYLAGYGFDPEGKPVTFAWRLVSGPAPLVSWAYDTPELEMLAPFVSSTTVLVFELTVTDTNGFSEHDQVNVEVHDIPSYSDPDLEPGFPVKVFTTAGTYQGGPQAMVIAVGNLDADPQLEVMTTATASGPLWAWNHDGTPLPGWPDEYGDNAGYPAIGNLVGSSSMEEVAAGYGPFFDSCHDDRFLFTGAGEPLPGWPQSSCKGGTDSPPVLADLDGDGLDEVLMGVEIFRASGARLEGWPEDYQNEAVATADLDEDGELDVILSMHDELDVRRPDGTSLPGFPRKVVPRGYWVESVVVGDVNGDGAPEILRPRKSNDNSDPKAYLEAYDANGALLWVRRSLGRVAYDTVLSLADLDGDGFPEVLMQSDGGLDVWKGDGAPLSGWPKAAGEGEWLSSSAPVVGDVDGDQLPDVVVVSKVAGGPTAIVRAYSAGGELLPRFPKTVPAGYGRTPAIADIDLDGRNEILVGGTFWNGHTGMKDALWVFDLGGPAHGPILWGQMGGDARHRNVYPVP